MGKLVVTEFVSIDGVFEDPGGAENYEHGGWTFEYDRGDDGNQFKVDELMDADVQLFGRKTYEGFAAAWPSRDGRVRGQDQQRREVRGHEHAHRPDVAEHDRDLGRRRRRRLEAQGRDRRQHPRRRQRHAGAGAARARTWSTSCA